jgi:Domain of unknown function (DUF4832)/Domain of unknown function (DUF4874)
MTRREWLLATMAAGLGSCGSRGGTLEFSESEDLALNPERGFYVQKAAEESAGFAGIRASGSSLILLTLDLRKFNTRALPDAWLERLEVALTAARAAGLKVIFRAAYGFTDDDYRADPEDLGLVKRHIRRMGSVLSKHTPIVWAVQAGMLGPWGEWHGSVHGNPPSHKARRTVAETWLESLPEEIYLQVRRPMFVRDLFTAKEDGFRARTGWHNDAMLALPDDMGTYNEEGWDRASELRWSDQQSKKTPFGGETVPASEGMSGDQVLRELKLLRISYLNRGYHGGTLERWRQLANGSHSVYAEVDSRLGHRWVLRRLRPSVGGGTSVMEIENTGFAPLYTPRKVEAAWLDPETMKPTGPVVATGEDLKGWSPDSGLRKISFRLPAAPPGAVPGLRFPDASAELREDGRYAIRLMNMDMKFDEKTGWNLPT